MSIAIKFGDTNDPNSVAGVIYFDAVTKYDKQYGGKVTSHPVEHGASISDHYISNNKKYKISGVVSSIDFSPIPSLMSLSLEEDVFNKNETPLEVTVSNLGGFLTSAIPDVVSQFLGTTSPTITVDPIERTNYRLQIESMMEEILHGLYYNEDRERYENRMTLITLFEMEGSVPSKIIEDLVITSFNVTENTETGDALFFDMSLEQVNFVTLEKAEAPSPPKKTKTDRATTNTQEKGSQTGGEVTPAPDERVYAADFLGIE